MIVGSSNSVSAPSPQTVGGVSYAFRSWSDGGAASPQRHRARHARRPTPPRSVAVGCPASPSFDYTMPTPTGPPAATSLPDGRIAFSALGSDGQYYLVATDIIERSAGGRPAGVPRRHRDGQPGRGGRHVVRRPVRPHGRQPTLAAHPHGRQQRRLVPAPDRGRLAQRPERGGDHQVMSYTSSCAAPTARSITLRAGARPGRAWENLGGGIHGTPAVASRPGGGIAIVVRGTNNGIYAKYGDTGSWTGWSRLPGDDAVEPDGRVGLPGRSPRPVRRRAPPEGCTRGRSSTAHGAAGFSSTRPCRHRRGSRPPPAAGVSSSTPRPAAPPRTSSTSGGGSATTRRHTRAPPASRLPGRARHHPADGPACGNGARSSPPALGT